MNEQQEVWFCMLYLAAAVALLGVTGKAWQRCSAVAMAATVAYLAMCRVHP